MLLLRDRESFGSCWYRTKERLFGSNRLSSPPQIPSHSSWFRSSAIANTRFPLRLFSLPGSWTKFSNRSVFRMNRLKPPSFVPIQSSPASLWKITRMLLDRKEWRFLDEVLYTLKWRLSYRFSPSWVPNHMYPNLSWQIEEIALCDSPFRIVRCLNSSLELTIKSDEGKSDSDRRSRNISIALSITVHWIVRIFRRIRLNTWIRDQRNWDDTGRIYRQKVCEIIRLSMSPFSSKKW